MSTIQRNVEQQHHLTAKRDLAAISTITRTVFSFDLLISREMKHHLGIFVEISCRHWTCLLVRVRICKFCLIVFKSPLPICQKSTGISATTPFQRWRLAYFQNSSKHCELCLSHYSSIDDSISYFFRSSSIIHEYLSLTDWWLAIHPYAILATVSLSSRPSFATVITGNISIWFMFNLIFSTLYLKVHIVSSW